MIVARDSDWNNLLVHLDWLAAPEQRIPHAGNKLPLEERARSGAGS